MEPNANTQLNDQKNGSKLRLETKTPEVDELAGFLGSKAYAGVDRVRELEDTRRAMIDRVDREKQAGDKMIGAFREATQALEAAERAEILTPCADHSAAVAAAKGRLADLQADQAKHRRAEEVLRNESDRFTSEISEARADAREIVLVDLNQYAKSLSMAIVEAVKAFEPAVVEAISAIRTVNSLERGPGQTSVVAGDLIKALELVFKVSGGTPPHKTPGLSPRLVQALSIGAFLGPDPERIPLTWLDTDKDLQARAQLRLNEARAARAAERADLPSAGAAGADEMNREKAADSARIREQHDANRTAIDKREGRVRDDAIPSAARGDLPSAGKQGGSWLER